MRISDWSSDVCSSDLVPVAAVVVVDGEHVGLLVAQDLRQALGGLLHISGPERPGLVVLRGAHHPGVDDAQALHPRTAEDLRGTVVHDDAAISQSLACLAADAEPPRELPPGDHTNTHHMH